MDTDTFYKYVCRRCEEFFELERPMSECPGCGSEGDTACISVWSRGKWIPMEDDEWQRLMRLYNAVNNFGSSKKEINEPNTFSC